MDTTDSMIVFDDQGVCDHCNTFNNVTLPSWDTGERGQVQLAALVETIKREGQGKDFDCIIGMSGGIDSSYLTYIAKRSWGCVHWCFMWMQVGTLKLRLIILSV
jgi:hypothetical protein